MRKVFYEGPQRFIFIPLSIAAFLSLISLVVMQLWNHLLPDILHVGAITFWQAMGIFVLSKILFGIGGKGGGGFGRGGSPWMRKRMEERLKTMSPEERERFKEQMKNRMCGPGGRRGWGRYNWDDNTTTETTTPNA
ncbi:hypothetical protein [Mucilaginibacter polytrichastri]|uniref:Uncharacterized protein n=1 Tax=Mucilaginibacter polytrichastri TaxID=1302689 RepID=A0A1Q6A2P3_9SPHI|nr:hypothetical protein [Mucilaginibacter polytrichastri]OKS88268.1 hypothetical protein RG47T_3734 [Mucilaginibacter polytrichastri]SFT13235.1 hypothetical protein SAMN04487890_1126 [Mucilaginibacter polytrichastri]